MPNPQVGNPRVQVTHTGPVFRVERMEFDADATGAARTKDVVRHPGAVTVIAVRDDGMLILIRNRRIGYHCARIEKLGTFFTSPGFTDEIMHVFLATGLTPVPQRLEPGEEIEVVEWAEADLRAAISAGEILDGKTLGAYLLWSMKRPPASGAVGATSVAGSGKDRP